ncbi:hypothetical protein Rsub_11145 [Raphidocelis subcapitata]|uniref:Uncharacterized protein n=1 Tax=Raphidocelis subcapitata TaxID=307507 RepID=A0A2V0PDW0_9CHLO|nr:hypothetical protein Rsub_11145 [Raphidocelis subcapitata]|eukprot:GBF98034.1 hypothetical protein Rsub_11145 [Raphidocelis subcapitata]
MFSASLARGVSALGSPCLLSQSRRLSSPARAPLQPARSPVSSGMPQTRGQRAAVAAKAGSGDAASGERHACLHDFCMSIPYGATAVVGGLASQMFGGGSLGLQVAAAGASVLVASAISLRSWRSGGLQTPFTLASAAASAWVAHTMWGRIAAGASPVVSGIMLALSGALAAFCVYNVAAGGNPPPKAKPASA